MRVCSRDCWVISGDQIYLFLVSSAGFAFLFSYLAILSSQLVIRRREGCRPGVCQTPGYPALS